MNSKLVKSLFQMIVAMILTIVVVTILKSLS